MIEIILPAPRREATLAALIDELAHAPCLTPFSDAAMAYLAAFAELLLHDQRCKNIPAFTALGFWLRRAALHKLQQRFAAAQDTDVLTVPAGLVFHIPPANVDTMFVYSWALALLLGNKNVLRLPGRRGATLDLLATLAGEALEASPAVAAVTRIVAYPHDAAVTAAFSRAADLRVIWGGDRAVEAIRAAPLAPHGREIVFPNRFSLALISLDHWRKLDAHARRDLAERFYNDIFWFDQRGCASPRLLLWHGGKDGAQAAHAELTALIAAEAARRNWQLDLGGAARKEADIFEAVLDLPIESTDRASPALVSLWLEDIAAWADLRRQNTGGGILAACAIADPLDIVPHVTREDQTLTYAGFAPEDMTNLAKALNGRGIDRIVPAGQALAFGPVWDGYDLLAAFGRKVQIV